MLKHFAWRATVCRHYTTPRSHHKVKPSILELLNSSAVTGKRVKTLSFPTVAAAACAKNIHANQMSELDSPDAQIMSHSGGEDAYFIRPDSLGVADGVGGWVNVKGANSALYSRMLMHYSAMEFQNYDTPDFEADPLPPIGDFDPKYVLIASYKKMKDMELQEGLVGSTTAIVAHLKNDKLSVANIGDGGIMVIRDGDIIFRSEEQQHSFNFPFQLGSRSRDSPKDAQMYTLSLKESDIVIMASDGIWDNLFDNQILEIVKSVSDNATDGGVKVSFSPSHPLLPRQRRPALHTLTQEIADSIIAHAKLVGENQYVESPFQTKASLEGIYYQGGKNDDMTCLVAVARELEDSPDRR